MIKNIYKEYSLQNRKIIGIYSIVTVLFYGFIYLFLRHTIDVPLDLVFSIAYVVFVPGIILTVTMYRSFPIFRNKREYYYTIMIHSIIPLIISIVTSALYSLIRLNQGYFIQIAWLHILAVPIILVGCILLFEYRNDFQYMWLKILLIVLLVISYFVLHIIFYNYEFRYLINVIDIVYFYGIPLLLVGVWYPSDIVILKPIK